jgi:hypothetical protein
MIGALIHGYQELLRVYVQRPWRMHLRWAGRAVAGVLLALAPLTAALPEESDAASVYGVWASSGTMIEVTPAGPGLSARIIALKHPDWREKDGVGRVGEPRTDIHNPDPALRDRPLIGVELLEGFHFINGRWRGRLYLPTNGSTWNSSARVRNGVLELRGYLGIPLFGRSETFVPVAACNEDILRMLSIADIADAPCERVAVEAGR